MGEFPERQPKRFELVLDHVQRIDGLDVQLRAFKGYFKSRLRGHGQSPRCCGLVPRATSMPIAVWDVNA
jgi:hypothetical protein